MIQGRTLLLRKSLRDNEGLFQTLTFDLWNVLSRKLLKYIYFLSLYKYNLL